MSIPRARFLPQKPPMLVPRVHREPSALRPPPSAFRHWAFAFVIATIVAIAFIGALVALVLGGVLPGEFVKLK